MGHFLRTKSCRRKHACADLQKVKESYDPSDSGGRKLIAFGDKKGTLLCSEYFGLRWSESNGLPLKCLVKATEKESTVD